MGHEIYVSDFSRVCVNRSERGKSREYVRGRDLQQALAEAEMRENSVFDQGTGNRWRYMEDEGKRALGHFAQICRCKLEKETT